jgi:uncharacterized membrane protein YoaK (UPF0700 family)
MPTRDTSDVHNPLPPELVRPVLGRIAFVIHQRATTLAIALTVVTGATDAISFLGLGAVFSSVMTGNLVLLGLSAGRPDGRLAVRVAIAIVGYALGTVVGSRIAGSPTPGRPTWPRRVSVALLLEMLAYAGFLAGWEASGAHPSGEAQLVLLAAAVLAMGVQSGAVRAVGVPGLSTTYLTGTLVAVLGELANGRGWGWRNVSILAGLIIGAAGGGALVVHAPGAAPALPVGVLALVLVASVPLVFRRSTPEGSA